MKVAAAFFGSAWFAVQVTPAVISGLDFGDIGLPNQPVKASQNKGGIFFANF